MAFMPEAQTCVMKWQFLIMLRNFKGDGFKHLVDSSAWGALEQTGEEGSLPCRSLS
jgi:hypothetical protein